MVYCLVEALGWSADVCFLAAYFLVSTKRIHGEGKEFNLLNLGGALLYGVYAIIKGALPIFILEVFWGGIGVCALWKLYRQRNSN